MLKWNRGRRVRLKSQKLRKIHHINRKGEICFSLISFFRNKNEADLQKNRPIATTSGSELEIEQRVLMKGNIMAPRNSLFDFIQFNSWIKKSNYEGIFNLFLVIFGFVFFHKPIVNFMKMGRPYEPEIFINIF